MRPASFIPRMHRQLSVSSYEYLVSCLFRHVYPGFGRVGLLVFAPQPGLEP